MLPIVVSAVRSSSITPSSSPPGILLCSGAARLYCRELMVQRSTITRLGLTALAMAVAGCGQVTRQMTLKSEPSGALVYLNGCTLGE